MQGVALRQQQHAVKLVVPVAGQSQLDHLLFVEARQVHFRRMLQDLGNSGAGAIAQDPVAVLQVIMQLHVAQGHKAVEPGVGHGLHDLLEPLPADALLQFAPELANLLGESLATDDGHITLDLQRLDMVPHQSEQARFIGHRLDEFPPRLRGIGFDFSCVHSTHLLCQGPDPLTESLRALHF